MSAPHEPNLGQNGLAMSSDWPRERRLLVSIELTSACNFRCPFCPQSHRDAPAPPGVEPFTRASGFMARDVFERAVDECARIARCVELGFFGEQTLHPDYTAYLEHLGRRKAFRLETNTNVSMLTEPMMRAWVDARFDMVRLSVDAITPNVFNRARPGVVKDLSGAIVDDADRMAAVNEKIERWLAMPDHRPTRLVYVKSSHNDVPGERERFLEHWQPRLGPDDQVLMKSVISYGGKIEDSKLQTGTCNVWDVGYLVIDHAGNISPCNLDVNMSLQLGSIMRDSIESMYHGEKANALRHQTGCGNDLQPCRTCHDGNFWDANETFRSTAAGQACDSTGPVDLRISA